MTKKMFPVIQPPSNPNQPTNQPTSNKNGLEDLHSVEDIVRAISPAFGTLGSKAKGVLIRRRFDPMGMMFFSRYSRPYEQGTTQAIYLYLNSSPGERNLPKGLVTIGFFS